MLFRYTFDIKLHSNYPPPFSILLRGYRKFTDRGVALNLVLELVTGVESYHPPGLNRDGFTGSRVAAWSRRLGANLEISEA
jgi:hypothetical protein